MFGSVEPTVFAFVFLPAHLITSVIASDLMLVFFSKPVPDPSTKPPEQHGWDGRILLQLPPSPLSFVIMVPYFPVLYLYF